MERLDGKTERVGRASQAITDRIKCSLTMPGEISTVPDASADKPLKRKPEDCPWYLLATLFGVPDSKELQTSNSDAWRHIVPALLSSDAGARSTLGGFDWAFVKRRGPESSVPFPQFDGAVPVIDFSNIKFDSEFRVEGFVFPTHVNFSGAIFSLGARFRHATFSGAAWFDDVTFIDTAWFDHTTFSSALFHHTTFSGAACFKDATFSSEVSFNGIFSGEAWFNRAIFSDGASFKDATFSRVRTQLDHVISNKRRRRRSKRWKSSLALVCRSVWRCAGNPLTGRSSVR